MYMQYSTLFSKMLFLQHCLLEITFRVQSEGLNTQAFIQSALTVVFHLGEI